MVRIACPGRFKSAQVVLFLLAIVLWATVSTGSIIDAAETPLETGQQPAITDITQFTSKVLAGSGWRVYFGEGLNVTLDGVTRDRAQVKIEKIAQFVEPCVDGVGQTLEILFQQIDVNAVPHIVVDSESVFNQTGCDWTGFRFSLTDATNGSDEQPTFNETATFLDNDPLLIAPFTYYSLSGGGTELIVAGGMLPHESVWIPGSGNGAGELVINAAPICSGTLRTFYFNEQPLTSLPEPAAGLLALFGLQLFMRVRR